LNFKLSQAAFKHLIEQGKAGLCILHVAKVQ
jgi:hypothetical protein